MNKVSHIKYYIQICPNMLRQIYNFNTLKIIKTSNNLSESEYNTKLELLKKFDEHPSLTYTKMIEQEAEYCNVYGYDKWIEKMLDSESNDSQSNEFFSVRFPDLFWVLNYNQVNHLTQKSLDYKLNYDKYINFISFLDGHSGYSIEWTKSQSNYINHYGLKNWLNTKYALNGYSVFEDVSVNILF